MLNSMYARGDHSVQDHHCDQPSREADLDDENRKERGGDETCSGQWCAMLRRAAPFF
jgi:hypothetical protein